MNEVIERYVELTTNYSIPPEAAAMLVLAESITSYINLKTGKERIGVVKTAMERAQQAKQ